MNMIKHEWWQSHRAGDDVHVAGAEFGKAARYFGHQEMRVLKAVRVRTQHHDGKGQAVEWLLMGEVLVHR